MIKPKNTVQQWVKFSQWGACTSADGFCKLKGGGYHPTHASIEKELFFSFKYVRWRSLFNGHYFKCVFESINNLRKHNNSRIPDLSRISGNAKNKRHEITPCDALVLEDLNKNRKKKYHVRWLCCCSYQIKISNLQPPCIPTTLFCPVHENYYSHESSINLIGKTQFKKWIQVTQHNTQLWIWLRRNFETKSGQRRWSKETKSYRAIRWFMFTTGT